MCIKIIEPYNHYKSFDSYKATCFEYFGKKKYILCLEENV